MALRFFAGKKPAWPASYFLAEPRLLFLDFDGTLSRIAASPGRARIDPGARRELARLSSARRTLVVVVSGRGLLDLKRKVGLKRAVYVGNHGLTCSRPALGVGGKSVAPWTRAATRAGKVLEALARRFPGAIVEAKGPDLSLHYRLVKKGAASLVRTAESAMRGKGFRSRAGKKVLEFVPRLGAHKGTAVRRLSGRLAPGWRRTGVCVYIGDDRTDEDAFGALRVLGRRAFGFKVGKGPTAARYRLENVLQVRRLLRGFGSRAEGG